MKQVFRIIMIIYCALLFVTTSSSSEKPVELSPMVVSSSRLKITKKNYAGSVSIITEEELEKKQYPQVLNILKEEPGLEVVQSGSFGATTSVFMRGAGSSSTLVLIDGVQANSNTTGSFNFADLNTENIERIEIIRGTQSTLWGSDAVGGVISITTKHGKRQPSHSLSFEGGSFGTFKETLNSSGDLGIMDYALSASRTDIEGFSSATENRGNVENDSYENTTLSARLGRDFSDGGRLDFVGRYTKKIIDFDTFGFVDGKPFSKGDSFYLATPVQKSLTDRWDLKINPTFAYDFLKTLDPGGSTPESKILNRTFDLDVQNNVEINNYFSSAFGFEYELRNGVNEGKSLRRTIRNKGLYFQAQFQVAENIALTAGVRHDINSAFKNATTHKYETSYRFQTTGTRLRGAYGTGFRAPTINELYFPNFGTSTLKPEESKSWEVGLDQTLMGGNLVIGITYFETEFENLIETVDLGGSVFRARNVAKATAKGVETNISLALPENFKVTTNYTFLNSRDDDGEPLVRRPEHSFNANVSHTWKEKLHTLAGVRVRGKTRSNSTGTNITEAFTTYRVAMSYRVNKRLKITARGENILDENYEENFGFGTAGASGYGGFTWSFD